MRPEPALTAPGSDVRASMLWGLAVAGVLIAGIFFGSRGLKDFDPALVSYAGASVFSAFGIGYRYSMWLRRPPTRLYWIRGWQFFLAPKRLPGNIRTWPPRFPTVQSVFPPAVDPGHSRSGADELQNCY